ncbi:MAG: NTP transferase domain-containing protein [Chrysiogenetes bacterium]|nr:NTP transferase domain-containing protein [Chrysiogenetes bacterium]
MRGVILAGGSGSRLAPLTKTTNKHLLPVGHEPMIYHPIKKLTDAGISDILVVTGVEHMGQVVNQLGSGKDFGCRFTYKVQDEPGGIAQALGLAEQFAAGHPVIVLLGDNIFGDALSGHIKTYEGSGKGAMVLLKEVSDPQRFGVARFDGETIAEIIEKPKDPPSNSAITGIYFYDARVFDFIRRLKPSARGELEITDVNNRYLELGELAHARLSGYWTDAGTHESLARANALVLGLKP